MRQVEGCKVGEAGLLQGFESLLCTGLRYVWSVEFEHGSRLAVVSQKVVQILVMGRLIVNIRLHP